MTDGHFHRHIAAALVAIRDEVPPLHRAMVAAFGEHVVAAEVEVERVVLIRVGEELRVQPAGERRPRVRARTTHALLCELLGGQTTVLAALDRGRLELHGSVDDLLALEDALHLFVQAAVRSPSLPHILRSFRRAD